MCLLIIVLFTNLVTLNAVKIDKVILPDVIQSGAPEGAVLDCLYTVNTSQFTLQWLFNNSHVPVYEWKPNMEPVVGELLEGRLDLTYRISTSATDARRALHITSLEPDLSGEYTCKVVSNGSEARLTRPMLVFSPERDFTLVLQKQNDSTRIQCIARGVYPKPELTLEHDSLPFERQQQRVWRSDGSLFDAESTAALLANGEYCHPRRITCRLQLPQAGYVAMKKELIYVDGEQNCKNGTSSSSPSIVLYLAFLSATFHSRNTMLRLLVLVLVCLYCKH